MQLRSSIRRRGAISALLALLLCLALLPAASSAAVPQYDVGDRITFRVRNVSPLAQQYGVYVTVAAKRRLTRYGELKRTEVGTFARMIRKRGGVYTYTPPPYTFPTWFMMRPGTYYWQTSNTDCSVAGCSVYSRVRSFKVV